VSDPNGTERSEPYVPPLPAENVRRGTLFAVPVLPIGVVAWILLWSVGFLASILALGLSLGSYFLYRYGSGGRIGRFGAILVTVITVVGIAASLIIGVVLDASDAVPTPADELVITVVLSVIFGALGCFIAWRTEIVQARAEERATRKPLPGFEDGPGTDSW